MPFNHKRNMERKRVGIFLKVEALMPFKLTSITRSGEGAEVAEVAKVTRGEKLMLKPHEFSI